MSIGAVLQIDEYRPPNYREKPIEYIITEKGCWECISHATTQYPRPQRSGRRVAAHRHVYELLVKPIGEGMCLCHKCDNVLCVNPVHMFEGTHSDNALDREAKGRGVDNNDRRDSKGRYC